MNSNCSNLLDMRNLQEQVKKAFCYQKLFWPFTVWINCSSDLKIFANSRPSASNIKSFFWSLEEFFLTVGQNNFDINKIPLFCSRYLSWALHISNFSWTCCMGIGHRWSSDLSQNLKRIMSSDQFCNFLWKIMQYCKLQNWPEK